jgi:hypothetical protein
MPVLKKYSDSYEKDGYYVHAPISDLDFPLPLQTPTITANIYRELGYGHLDNVPNELTWKMYDVGLHWTENSGPRDTPDELSVDDLVDDGPALTGSDVEKIGSLIDGYEGKHQERVKSLQDQLTPDFNSNGPSSFPTPKQSFEGLSEESRKLIDEWEPSGVAAEGEDGLLFSPNRGEFRKDIAAVSEIATTLQNFDEHPMAVSHITTTTVGDDSEDAIRVEFETDTLQEIRDWTVTDTRPASVPQDFQVHLRVKGDRSYSFKIADGYIGDFDVKMGYGDVGKFNLPDRSNWIYEVEGLNKDEVHHALLSDFLKVVPQVGQFFVEAPFYAFESVDLDERLVKIPTV